MARLKWNTPGYPIVRISRLREVTVLTEWLGWEERGGIFETAVIFGDVDTVVGRAPIETEAVALHYRKLGEVIASYGADISEVR